MKDPKRIARAFDKWMDDYANNPEAYNTMAETAAQHLRERNDGREPSYGQRQAATLQAYYDKA